MTPNSAQAKSSEAIANQNRPSRYDPVDTLVFLIPCLQFVQLKVIGVLNGSDILLLVAFLYFFLRGMIRISTPVGKRFVVLCLLWLASQCVTDIVKHTVFTDYARGWSNIGMTLVNFVALWTLLYGRPRRLALYGWGLVAGSLLTYFINPDGFMQSDPWKFGLAYPVTFAVFLIVSSGKWRSHSVVVMIAVLGLFNVYMGSRNRGGVCLAAALYLLVAYHLRRNYKEGVKLKSRTVAAIAAAIALGVVAIFWVYQYTASAGLLGEEARFKYEGQSAGKYGVLLGGRTEILASLPAIYDSPILGHGSWAKDPTYSIIEIESALALGYKDALEISQDTLKEGLIPTHSHIFSAWVYAGIVGAIFWGWVLVLTVRAMLQAYPPNVVLLPVMSFVVFSLLWDIPFSPYGATGRIAEPYYIVLMATCIGMVPRKTAKAATFTRSSR